MGNQPTKREAGASRKDERRDRIDITLPRWAVDYLDKQEIDGQKISRSRFIEALILTHKRQEELARLEAVQQQRVWAARGE